MVFLLGKSGVRQSKARNASLPLSIIPVGTRCPSSVTSFPRVNDGSQGPPGEVTNADLASALSSAISGTSNNTNSVSTLGIIVSDPPTQSEMQSIANKLDELINALRR